MIAVLIRERERELDTDTQGRRLYDDGGRDWSDAVTSQGRPGASRRGKEGFFPRTHSLANTLISDF